MRPANYLLNNYIIIYSWTCGISSSYLNKSVNCHAPTESPEFGNSRVHGRFWNRTVVVVKLSWDDWSWLNSFFANSARLFNMLKIFFCITIYILFFAVFCDIYYRILRISFWLMQYLCLCNNNSFHMLWKLIHDIFKNIRHYCKYFNSCKKLLLFITLSVFN